MAFLDLLFPDTPALGMVGGPRFNTLTIPSPSGDTALMSHWDLEIGAWDLVQQNRTAAETITLLTLFRLAKGRAHGFKFHDHGDDTGTDEFLGTGDGADTTFQLRKLYTEGALVYTRPIYNPVAGTVTVALNGTPTTAFTVTLSTGIVTLTVAPGVGVLVTASFLFYVPVRFDVDTCDIMAAEPGVYTWAGIRLVELREPVPCTAVPVALQTDMAICLDLGEASGTRYDSVGTTDMTPINGVTALTGKSGLAAHFEATLFQSLSASSVDTTFNTGNFTWAFWARPGILGVAQALLSQARNTAAGQYEWFIEVQADGSLRTIFGAAGAGTIISTEILSVGAWAFVMVWHDNVNLYLQVNNGAIDSSAGALFIVEGGLPFQIGAIGQDNPADHAANNDFFTGDIQAVMLWRDRVLTQEERDELWNEGDGVRCVCA